jgi:hypothetical protein
MLRLGLFFSEGNQGMSGEKKVTTTRVFIGDAMTVKHVGKEIAEKKLTTEHLKVGLGQQGDGGKAKPEPAQDGKKEGK